MPLWLLWLIMCFRWSMCFFSLQISSIPVIYIERTFKTLQSIFQLIHFIRIIHTLGLGSLMKADKLNFLSPKKIHHILWLRIIEINTIRLPHNLICFFFIFKLILYVCLCRNYSNQIFSVGHDVKTSIYFDCIPFACLHVDESRCLPQILLPLFSQYQIHSPSPPSCMSSWNNQIYCD